MSLLRILCYAAGIILMSVVTASTAAAQELITNGTFDADIDGWMIWDGGLGVLEWSPAQGQPPGALKIDAGDQEVMTTACYQFEPGTLFFAADGFMESSGERYLCNLNFFLYETADCTGDFGMFSHVGPGPSPIPEVWNLNIWEHLVFELGVPENPGPTNGFYSYRPALIKSGDTFDDDACVFDNISMILVPPQPAAEIPALSPVGLVAFVLLLLAAGIYLRRTRTRP